MLDGLKLRLLGRFYAAGLALLSLIFASFPSLSEEPRQLAPKFARMRQRMVSRQLVRRGIRDPRVLQAIEAVPRHLFVPEKYRFRAYEDNPLPIGEGQTISQPYVVALMAQLLELKGDDKVLEVGTGSGYQAAVLSHLAREVYSVEIIPLLAAEAQTRLCRLGYDEIQVKTGDGFFGWEEKGPFDAIVVTAAAEQIPESLWNQLNEGGRLVLPLGHPGKRQKLVRVRKVEGERHQDIITGVRFVPMTGANRRGSL